MRPPTPESRRRGKCDRDVKLHLPEALYDDLARQARADSRAVSEYIRVLLERHLYGALGAGRDYTLRSTPAAGATVMSKSPDEPWPLKERPAKVLGRPPMR